MGRVAVSGLMLVLVAGATVSAGDAPKTLVFKKEARTYFVPANYSPVRTARLRFHPVEPRLFAQVSDKRLAIWDLDGAPKPSKGSKEPQVLPEYGCEQAEGWITGFDIHPSGQWIVTGGSDRKLRKWAFKKGKVDPKPLLENSGHEGWIEAVAYSADGKSLATGCSDRKVRLFEADTLITITAYAGHEKPIRDLAWSPDGSFLFSGGEDGKVLIYSVSEKRVVRTLEFGNTNEQQGQDPAHSGVYRLACSPDGQWLSVCGQNKFGLFQVKSGKLSASESLLFDTVFYPVGTIVIAGRNDTKAIRFDPATLEKISLDPLGKKGKSTSPAGETLATLKRNDGFGLAITKDGACLAAALGESTVGLWKIVRK